MEIEVNKKVSLNNTTRFDLFGGKEDIIVIESFTEPGKNYEIDKKKKTCSCPSFKRSRTGSCKHLVFVLNDGKVPEKKVSTVPQSLLKSALQKAVRRNDPEKAVRIVKAMFDNDPVDLLRRLPIVVIEDSIMHPRFLELMKALEIIGKQGKIGITKDIQNMVVQITDDIARSEIRSWGFISKEKYEMDSIPFKLSEIEEKLPEDESLLINAVFRRRFLGGMAGDMEMIERVSKQFSKLFLDREFGMSEIRNCFGNSQIQYDEIAKFDKSDIMLEAVDFHCSPILRILMKKQYILELLDDVFTNDSMSKEDRLKDIVWRMRSGVNFKLDFMRGRPIDWFEDAADGDIADREKYEKVYSKIEVELNNLSKWFIDKSLGL